MSISEQPARLAVHNVDDLVGLVPYLLGFHPEESLVVLVLEQGHVAVTARVDLAGLGEGPALDEMLGRLFKRFPAAETWFLAFTDDAGLAWEVLAACVQVSGFARLGRILQVGSQEWRTDCPDGPTGPITGAVCAAAAQATVLGLPVRRSRRDLAAGLAGPPDAEVGALVAEFDARAAELEALGPRGRSRLLKRLLRTPGPCRVPDCVRLALLVARPEGLLAALRGLARANADQQLQLWTQVVRHCLVAQRPVVLGLLGMAAWQTGDGALQVVCLEELDRIDPNVAIAGVLDHLNAEVVPPTHWDGLRGRLLAALAEELTPAGPPTIPPGR